MFNDMSRLTWYLTWQLSCNKFNHYKSLSIPCKPFLYGLNITYIVRIKPFQGPILFRLGPNLNWAKSLFRANMISIKNQNKMSQNANSKHHKKDTQNVTDD
jgi:hypothetical protein